MPEMTRLAILEEEPIPVLFTRDEKQMIEDLARSMGWSSQWAIRTAVRDYYNRYYAREKGWPEKMDWDL